MLFSVIAEPLNFSNIAQAVLDKKGAIGKALEPPYSTILDSWFFWKIYISWLTTCKSFTNPRSLWVSWY